MEGHKIEQAREALRIFLDQIKGDMERVGLIQFSTRVDNVLYLDELGDNRNALNDAVDTMDAEGDTALLDAVHEAFLRLKDLNDEERINSIVVMTDGRENASWITLRQLVRDLQSTSGVPVVVFCIAYGSDADIDTLRAIAEPSGGRVLEGDLETIRDLYKILSTYF
jgi:Ca-activated chloride channel family protein